MKRYLMALALSLSLGLLPSNAVPKHRHHAPVTAIADTVDTGVEAYSDTSSVDTSVQDTIIDLGSTADSGDDWEESMAEGFLKDLLGGTIGIGGLLFALVVVSFVFLLLLSPFIILVLVIRYLIKKHNDKVTIAQQAMATGVPIPSDVSSGQQKTDDYLWQKGVKNVSVGLGLALFFYFLDATALVGIGFLVACMGVGQIYIAKKTTQRGSSDNTDQQKPEF
ncbi:DUF6249 domain-containing protein [Prevotella sp.]|uniref:DUF6249 domain-containing protein n=1 Tax=Prevotella sp. TaxID=59823 RepID=UPI002F91C388